MVHDQADDGEQEGIAGERAQRRSCLQLRYQGLGVKAFRMLWTVGADIGPHLLRPQVCQQKDRPVSEQLSMLFETDGAAGHDGRARRKGRQGLLEAALERPVAPGLVEAVQKEEEVAPLQPAPALRRCGRLPEVAVQLCQVVGQAAQRGLFCGPGLPLLQ